MDENIKIPKLDCVLVDGGGVASAQGFRAAGMHAGFKKAKNDLDLALVLADEPCSAAGVFTKNIFCAAPVQVSKAHLGGLGYGKAQAIIINAGNANASSGAPGLATAQNSTKLVADTLGCSAENVLVASTGVIGVPLPLELFEENVDELVASANSQGAHDAAQAIMTTDTQAKEYALSFTSADPDFAGKVFTVGGMAKGSGMIMPDMATMIAVLTTDAPVEPALLHAALKAAVNVSFNKVTVDSDTSTNDTCFIMASGKAIGSTSSSLIEESDSVAYLELLEALSRVCTELARMIAIDGEGATKLVTVKVGGAVSESDADLAARAVANSPLVKTAIFGHDANWGRIAMAIGKSGAAFQQEKVSIDLLGLPVCRAGLSVPFDEDEALRRFEAAEITIDIDLGAGSAETTIWTCDLTHEYISINGDYRS